MFKKTIFLILLIVTIIGLTFLYKQGKMFNNKDKKENANLVTDNSHKILPSDINKIDRKKEIKAIEINEDDKQAMVSIDLSDRTGFSAMRSIDRTSYQIKLSNTKLSETFSQPKQTQHIKEIKLDENEENLIVSFKLLPNMTISQLTYRDKDSSQLLIELNVFSIDDLASKVIQKVKSKLFDEVEFPEVRKVKTTISPLRLASQAYENALKAADEGDFLTAAQSAKESLAHRPDHHDARKMFIMASLQIGDKQAAFQALDLGLQIDPNNITYRKIKAKELLEENHPQEALVVLAMLQPNIAIEPDYYGFIAAAYEKIGNHEKAAQIYSDLLKVQPRNSFWWAGFAISSEAKGFKKQAYDAYKTANQLGGLTPVLKQYIEEKLKSYQPH